MMYFVLMLLVWLLLETSLQDGPAACSSGFYSKVHTLPTSFFLLCVTRKAIYLQHFWLDICP